MPKDKHKPKAKKQVPAKPVKKKLHLLPAKKPPQKARPHMTEQNLAPPQHQASRGPTSGGTKKPASEDKPVDITEVRKKLVEQADENEALNDEAFNEQQKEMKEARDKAAATAAEASDPDKLREELKERNEAEASLTSPEAIKRFMDQNKKDMAAAAKKG